MKKLIAFVESANQYSNLIQAFSAIIVLVIAFITIMQTNTLLNQQRDDAHTQYRAYLNLRQSTSDEVIIDDNYYHFPFILENKGLTAAEQINISIYLELSDDQLHPIYSSLNQHVYLTRDASFKYHFGIHKDDIRHFPTLTREKGNFLVIDVEYSDFQNRRYLLRSRYVIQSPEIKILAIYDTDEKVINE